MPFFFEGISMKRQLTTFFASLLFAYSALAAYQKPCTASEITRAAQLKTIFDTSIGGSLSYFLGYKAGTLIQPQLTGLSHDNALCLAILSGIAVGALTFMAFREFCMMAYARAGYSEHDRAKIRMKNNEEEIKLLIKSLSIGVVLLICAVMNAARDSVVVSADKTVQDLQETTVKNVTVDKPIVTVVADKNDTTDAGGSEYFICNE
jgi:hypothetical protein